MNLKLIDTFIHYERRKFCLIQIRIIFKRDDIFDEKYEIN
jgi:hypothetical protein